MNAVRTRAKTGSTSAAIAGGHDGFRPDLQERTWSHELAGDPGDHELQHRRGRRDGLGDGELLELDRALAEDPLRHSHDDLLLAGEKAERAQEPDTLTRP